ncbi:hypothetical protein JAO76_12450 [Pontibacter sp. BT310]|uniref:Uncharacterized protein n=1 Tax=Pontibacter populi TaxID=890055 RepID=A0ABS6XCZ7_9BACT|nr:MULTISPECIES: hypothetical protein [Pontibacter]MBJ6119009.1 hypothetical protein [Pontibacter sp. BT310]MBR0571437.1 hypothetical protein [Microvirga sp. STS03]MBW3365863.1 hypothetical protein [Pontibacter populi]
MKQLVLVCIILSSLTFSSYANTEISHPTENIRTFGIEDGWYEATVRYYNSSSYTRSTYTLSVKVQYDRVVAIDFGNGGSVHSGYNNSGYIYSGGTLSYQRDYSSGSITSATARVTVSQGTTMTTFDISIN